MTNPLVSAVGCPTPAAESATDPATRIGCTVSGVGDWLTTAPGRLAHMAALWPWLLAATFAVLAAVLTVRAVHRHLWRRAVRRGYWVRLTPPRTVNAVQAEHVWRLLSGLARLTRAGRHLTRPPLAFEVYGVGGERLMAGLWLPGWVPVPEVLKVAGRAWPGVRAEVVTAPRLTDAAGARVAGYRLTPTGTDVVALTDPPRPAGRSGRRGPGGDDDPLAAVLDGLRGTDGPAVLQVLARPATGRRLAELGHAARFGLAVRKPVNRRVLDGLFAVVFGAVRLLLLDLITELISSSSTARRTSGHGAGPDRPRNPVATRAMRDAGDKLADGPHLLAAVRVGTAGPGAGAARAAARSTAEAFITASRVLRPVRLRRAGAGLSDRWAGRGDWLLCTASELGVLAHVPTDPARYGFDTAALSRTPPTGARQARPERGSPRGPGWNRHGWTDPPDDNNPDDWEESA